MRREEFFDRFELLAEVHAAIPKLRVLILQLAVQGRLVVQSKADGRAADLFATERTILSEPVEPRYEVPTSWLWISFASVGDQRLGKMLDQKGNRGKLKPYLRNTNVQWMRFELDDVKHLRLEPSELEEYRLRDGDLLICEGGEPGRCAIWRGEKTEMYFQKALHRVRPRAGILVEYLAINLRADASNGVLAQHFTGATIKHLTGRSLEKYAIPLPPLAEQKRIVAKVDELMALCDRLEAQQKERDTRHAALARASLTRFADAPTPANLTFLFHNSYAIAPADLRKSILSLAVRGKLVPQGPSDVIATERVAEVTKPVDSDMSNPPFALPMGWSWLRVADAFEVAGGIQKTPDRAPRHNAYPYVGVANVYRGRLDLSVLKQFELAPGELDRRRLESGDLLIIEGNGSFSEIGRCAKWNGEIADCVHQNHVIRCRPLDTRISDFVLLFLNSPDGTKTMQRLAITSSGLYSLSVGKIRQIEFPLPPLTEQRRIVAKVRQLMTLVDELETQLGASRATAAKLLDAIVDELTAFPS